MVFLSLYLLYFIYCKLSCSFAINHPYTLTFVCYFLVQWIGESICSFISKFWDGSIHSPLELSPIILTNPILFEVGAQSTHPQLGCRSLDHSRGITQHRFCDRITYLLHITRIYREQFEIVSKSNFKIIIATNKNSFKWIIN